MRGQTGGEAAESSGTDPGNLGAALGTVVLLALAWEAASRSGMVHSAILPPVSSVLHTAAGLLIDPAFASDLGATALAVALAYAIAAPLAVLAGLALGTGTGLARRATSLLYVALAVPYAVFLPLLILALGVTLLQKVVFAAIVSFTIVCLNAVAAARSVDSELVRAARALGASRRQLWLTVHLPSMAPVLLTGLRYGLIFATVGVLISEMYGARSGVGPLIILWGETFQMHYLIAGIMIVAALTLLANNLIRRLELLVGHWRHVEETPLHFDK